MDQDHDLVAIGRISGVYGVKGWVKVFSYTQPRENILNYSPWLLDQGGDRRKVTIVAGKQHGKGIIVKLEGCEDRDQAAALTAAELLIQREQLVSLNSDEYYWADLIGLEVFNEKQELLGKVIRLLETGADDVLVVEGQKEHLIPFAQPQIIKQVDLKAGRIIADWEADY